MMKKTIFLLLMITLGALGGCGTTTREPAVSSQPPKEVVTLLFSPQAVRYDAYYYGENSSLAKLESTEEEKGRGYLSQKKTEDGTVEIIMTQDCYEAEVAVELGRLADELKENCPGIIIAEDWTGASTESGFAYGDDPAYVGLTCIKAQAWLRVPTSSQKAKVTTPLGTNRFPEEFEAYIFVNS